MTTYLTAKRLAVSPYIEVYENYGPSLPPLAMPYKPIVAGVVDNIRFADSRQLMATLCKYRREDVPGIGNPTTPDPGGIVVFSPEDNFVLVGGTASSKPQLYRRRGPYYTPVPTPDWPRDTAFAAGEYITSASVSSNAQVITYFTNLSGGNAKVMDKSPTDEVWTIKATLGFGVTGVPLVITPDSKYIFIKGGPAGSGTSRLYRLVGTVYTLTAGPNAGADAIHDFVVRPNGDFWVLSVAANNTITVSKIVEATYTTINNQIGAVSTLNGGTLAGLVQFAQQGDIYFYCGNRTSLGSSDATRQFLYVMQWTGTAFAAVGASSQFIPTTGRFPTNSAACVTPDGKRIAVYSLFAGTAPIQSDVRIYDISGTSGAFTIALSKDWLADATISTTVLNFSPDGERLNMASGRHAMAVSPFTTLTVIPEAPGVTATGITTIYYGNLGQASFALNSTGSLIPVIKDGAGNYLDVRTLEGTFVSIWDRKGDNTFVERNFVQHNLGTVVTDMLFSPDDNIFSYHTERPDNADQSGLGRFIYDISTARFISYRGAIRTEGDTASLAAFNDDSSYAVFVFKNATAGNNVQLFIFETNYYFTHLDTDLVDYGPPAYSKCETVVVAHGGAVPYTLYAHIVSGGDRLEPVPVPPMDWSMSSNIFAAAFMPDCSALIIVGEDEIVIADPDTGEEVDSGPVELDPNEDEVTIQPDSPETIVIIENPAGAPGAGGVEPNPGPGTGGGPVWVSDGNTVNNISYIDYAAINITYKTWW